MSMILWDVTFNEYYNIFSIIRLKTHYVTLCTCIAY